MACLDRNIAEQAEARMVRPEPDRAGGAQITDLGDASVRVEGPFLRALDLLDAPQLEHLDLSGCRPGLFLALARCPRLQRIDLPAGEAGAVIHWDRYGAAEAEAVIHGPVEHLDLCGRGYAFGLPGGRAGAGPWRSARITASCTAFAAAQEEALALLGTEGMNATPGAEVLAVPSPARSVYVQGAGVDAVRIPEAAVLEGLALERMPGLREVASAAVLPGLTVERAERLEWVRASGEALQLRHCGDLIAGVGLEGAWTHALLADTTVSDDTAPDLAQVVVRGGERDVPNAGRRPHPWLAEHRRAPVQPSEVPLLLEAAQAGEARAGATLIRWTESVPRRNVLFALQTLYSLLECPDADAEGIWQARETLAGRFCGRRPRRTEWAWNLPEDLIEEALAVDFRLFARCRGRVAGTKRLDVHLRNTARSRELRLLAALAGDRRLPAPERTLAAELLREAMAVAARGLVGTSRGRGALGPPSDLGPLVRWIVEQADLRLADDLVAWIEHTVTVERRVRYLGELAAHGHAPSRAAALAIGLGRVPSGWRWRQAQRRAQAVRQQAMAVALAPARSDRLAEPDPDTGEEA